MSAYWGGHLSWVLALALVGLVHAIIWNRTYKTYVIKGKHRSGRNMTKVVHTVSEDKAVKIYRDFHKGSEIHSVKDTDQNGMNGTY